MNTIDTLFLLIRSRIQKTELSQEVKEQISQDMLAELYSLSAKHDLAHFVGDALSRENLLGQDTVSVQFKETAFRAFYRYERSKYELMQICQALNQAQIPFIPLKGSIIRDLYPEPWLRTSCDIDILVHEEDLEKAVSVLVSEKQYSASEKKDFHDISLYSPSGLHLELHFNIRESIPQLDSVLDSVWQYAAPSKEMPYRYELSNEFLLFHIVAHMSYHFTAGGCGIRPFLDLWLLEKNLDIQEETFTALLKAAQLLKFYHQSQQLSLVWLEGEKHTEITTQMEHYIILGGVYGTMKNKVLVQQQKKRGKWSYVFYRIFLPYEKLKILYPILEKKPWLTPFAQVCRWFQVAFDGRAKNAMRELSYNQAIPKSQAQEMTEFLDVLGLIYDKNQLS